MNLAKARIEKDFDEDISKDQIAMKIKFLLEEKAELEREIRVGDEAKTTIVFTEEKLNRLMQMYIGA